MKVRQIELKIFVIYPNTFSVRITCKVANDFDKFVFEIELCSLECLALKQIHVLCDKDAN